ncbi:hypothetical protein EGJ52_24980 [Pseudomonas luteola]|uniref:hypothetical protein n=1 Tax=Pseudomonas luteola TaxID=47886 RepID=UPI000F7AA1CA|nr:hypothetical protein [Pseudomonas luteola]RRW39133.1 hypothetical protein EGJ52_24980 [Pseudomonas luteola]
MHHYPLRFVDVSFLFYEGDLTLEIALHPGIEILPLFRVRLAGLLSLSITSIKLTYDGWVRVLITNPDISDSGREPGYGNMPPLKRVSFNIFSEEKIPRYFIGNFNPTQGFPPELLDWTVRACMEPSIAISLGLVEESALPLLESFSTISALDDDLEKYKKAVKRLLTISQAFAGILQDDLESKVVLDIIRRLRSTPALGFVSECKSYWAEICELDTDFLFYDQLLSDIRDHAQKVISDLNIGERLALILVCQDYDEWMYDSIENTTKRESLSDIELLIDANPLLDKLVNAVLDEAIDHRDLEQGDLFL